MKFPDWVTAVHGTAGLLSLLLSVGCIEVTIPADDAGSSRQPPGGRPRVTPGTPTTPSDDVSVGLGPGLDLIDSGATTDAGASSSACETHCDCAGGQDCINGRCITGALSIYCCDVVDCPTGSDCWSSAGVPGVCGTPSSP